ncbi:hypothetical protein Taro_041554 [Colocasia esculenta]|uniref:Uncharacterized protein n=1 Tax=Colocasia esculenta TaxID=4460 RepID=A0A843WQ81_COLES|nr:hypothetical protein [Colocasia esculenta]
MSGLAARRTVVSTPLQTSGVCCSTFCCKALPFLFPHQSKENKKELINREKNNTEGREKRVTATATATGAVAAGAAGGGARKEACSAGKPERGINKCRGNRKGEKRRQGRNLTRQRRQWFLVTSIGSPEFGGGLGGGGLGFLLSGYLDPEARPVVSPLHSVVGFRGVLRNVAGYRRQIRGYG